jgi:hypothetical protein
MVPIVYFDYIHHLALCSIQFCNDVKDTEYVQTSSAFNAVTNEYEIVQTTVECPRPGLIQHFTCANGVMEFDKQVCVHANKPHANSPGIRTNMCRSKDVWHDGLAPVDSILADYRTRAGYVVNASTNFYKCPVPGACKVNSTTGGVACASGSTGVLCDKCQDRFMQSTLAGGKCVPCPPNALLDVLWPWIALVVIVLSGRVFWLYKGKLVWNRAFQYLFPGETLQVVFFAQSQRPLTTTTYSPFCFPKLSWGSTSQYLNLRVTNLLNQLIETHLQGFNADAGSLQLPISGHLFGLALQISTLYI